MVSTILRGIALGAAVLALLAASPLRAQTASVELALRQRPGTVIPNIVEVAVGGGAPVPLTFDTGSHGLRLLESSAGPAIRRTDHPLHEAYGDGTVFDGVLAYARLAFPTRGGGSVETATEVPIALVTRVSCEPAHPDCPGMSRGRVGIMGVRFNVETEVVNPLAFLPGNLGSGFIVDATARAPTVTLGLTDANTAGFRFAPLRPDRPAVWAGDGTTRGWITSSVRGCFAVAGMAPACEPVLFDTGDSAMSFATMPPPAQPTWLLRGSNLRFSAPGLFDYAFHTTGHKQVRIQRGMANSGEYFFQHFRVAFDQANGRIGFMPK